MARCVGDIAGSIQLDCESPIAGGYTGRGIFIPAKALQTLTRDAQNPRIVTNITLASGAKVVYIDNESTNAFNGSTTTGTNENGRVQFTKIFVTNMPERGADFAASVLEPYVKDGRGGVLVLEKVDRRGDGSFELIGTQDPARVIDPSTVARNEYENGAAWVATMQSTEDYAEVVLFDTDYTTTLAKFQSLMQNAF